MRWMHRVRSLLGRILGRARRERDLDEELKSFVEMESAALERTGAPPAAAKRQASMKFGGIEQVKEEVRSRRFGAGMETLFRDIRFAVRVLLKNPGFTLAASLTLALGIGANTAIFSITEATLFRSPAVEKPEELAAVWTTCRRGNPRCSSSYPDFLDYGERSTLLEDLAAYTWITGNLGSDAGSRLVTTQLASGNYFNLLGVSPAMGRLLQPGDDQKGSASNVVVVSHELWSTHFGADPTVVGQKVRLNSTDFEVIGVTPEGFGGLHLGDGADLYVPLLTGPALGVGMDGRFERRGSRWIAQLVGRMRPGVSIEELDSEMISVADQLAEEFPEARGPRRITVDEARQFILPIDREADLVRFVAVLLGVVGLTLLLACANLANLLLARAAARAREIAVRLAIGASRARILRQLLTESVFLGLIGGAAGTLISVGILRLLAGYELPGGIEIGSVGPVLNTRILLATVLLSLLTGILFGLAPALQATRRDLLGGLSQGSTRGVSRQGGGRLRLVLVAAQVALCLVLLVGSGLFLKTLRNGLSTDLGFQSEGLAIARFDLSLLGYSGPQGQAFIDGLKARLEARPQVVSAGVGTRVPLLPGGTATMLSEVKGYEPAADEELRLEYNLVDADFIETLGLPVLMGETFASLPTSRRDRAFVINETMAKRWFREREPVGGQVVLGDQTFDVVGVVGDTKWRGLQTESVPFAYVPMSLSEDRVVDGRVQLVVRSRGDAAAMLPVIRQELNALDPGLSLSLLSTMDQQKQELMLPQETGALLLTAFGILSLALAVIGVYGIVGYMARQRSREIGIRIALGARSAEILRIMVLGILGPLVAGIVAGVIAALAMGRSVETLMFGVESTDPFVLLAIVTTLAAATLVAALIPARRATRINPLEALGSD